MKTRTRIKICGICRPEDALLAAGAGADAIGIILYARAPRFVDLDQAKKIIAALPAFVTPVGNFVDAKPNAVLSAARELGLRHVQFHGDEGPADVRSVQPLVVIKALRVERDRLVQTLATWREAIRSQDLTNLGGFVLETAGTGQPGGTGMANDWEAVLEAQRSGGFDGLPPIIAAGGLNPQTVAGVVKSIRPYAVDVSSGVEEKLREKSEVKIRAFVQAVRDADV